MTNQSLNKLRKYVGSYKTQKAAAIALGMTPQKLNEILKGVREIPEGLIEALNQVNRASAE